MHKRLLLIATLLLTTGGCSTYYRVTDTQTGQTYYTRSHPFSPLAQPTPSSVTFTDLQSGDVIWLPSPTLTEVPESEALSTPAPPPLPLEETASATQPPKH